MIDEGLLKILTCPLCKTDVVLRSDIVVCTRCLRAYPVKDGINIMLVEEAQIYEKQEK
jgi:hypothetical protein